MFNEGANISELTGKIPQLLKSVSRQSRIGHNLQLEFYNLKKQSYE